ncbi:serine/threonine-protein kinase [Streptomyces melanogenes]|uniref:Serine/threonine protein kinase n=1 Tax=Streptomyces melanogenes TaxID=67326 RepID=A0ABZ1XLS9_9ACTN|nr:serine/threonine-protein kinase [Streptomyces melanogenes]
MDALKPRDPAHIGTYALLARLGAGGMGMVYLGRSPGGRLVALKVIKDEITDHPEALARFRREAETVRAVRSAYTANLIDASLAAPPYWLATEYVSGPTLSRAVADRGPFPADTCRKLFAALAEGLASVHAYGVTHRDLKPQNVILAPQGPQLIDFGIARAAADTALTQPGLAPGTPGYTAPEVLLRNEVADPADVFALGATIAFAATGRAPFGVGEAAGVSYRAVHEQIDLAGVEPRLAELIQACVAKDPAARPDAAEVIRRCAVDSALVEDEFYRPLSGLADAVPAYTPTRLPGPHDLPTATAAGPSGYTPTHMTAPAPPATVEAGGRPRRTSPWLMAATIGLVLGVAGAVTIWLLPGDKGGDGASARGGGPSSSSPGPTKSDTAPSGGGTKQGGPRYIEATKPSRDYWTPDGQAGSCNLPPEERQQYLLVSVVQADAPDAPMGSALTGKIRIKVWLKYAESTAKPYYVSVSVKPPHEIDANTGQPIPGSGQNLSLGYASKPVDLFRDNQPTTPKVLTYPDDFEEHVEDRTFKSIPVSRDPGSWTVQFHHVRGTKEYASVMCTGFVGK